MPFKKSSKNAAGLKPLAAFFLLSCSCISCSPQKENHPPVCAFTVGGNAYTFNLDDSPLYVKDYGINKASSRFTRNSVGASKNNGAFLAWDQENEILLQVNSNGRVTTQVPLKGRLVYLNRNYVLSQKENYVDDSGFEFDFYRINYIGKEKILLKKIWSGKIDLFISDCFFTENGICIAGGTRDNKTHNVFYITKNSIKNCFSMEKNSDFLRLIKVNENEVYAFLSSTDKASAVLYKFYLKGTIKFVRSLMMDKNLPWRFEGFAGYGFLYDNQLVLPAKVRSSICFIKYDTNEEKITGVVSDCDGCFASLAECENGFYYIARNPDVDGSFYGISLFDGNSCKRIIDFRQE
ncbi:MAG: hypothetical protein IKX23_11385 [Treponema sp.]|nr:hypothetical protein [Treponema sp.]